MLQSLPQNHSIVSACWLVKRISRGVMRHDVAFEQQQMRRMQGCILPQNTSRVEARRKRIVGGPVKPPTSWLVTHDTSLCPSPIPKQATFE
jgi:hypothetical protein